MGNDRLSAAWQLSTSVCLSTVVSVAIVWWGFPSFRDRSGTPGRVAQAVSRNGATSATAGVLAAEVSAIEARVAAIETGLATLATPVARADEQKVDGVGMDGETVRALTEEVHQGLIRQLVIQRSAAIRRRLDKKRRRFAVIEEMFIAAGDPVPEDTVQQRKEWERRSQAACASLDMITDLSALYDWEVDHEELWR